LPEQAFLSGHLFRREWIHIELLVVVPIIVALLVVAVVPMIVGDVAVVAIPIALLEALTIMMRFHPMRAGISWTRPVSVVPLIVSGDGVPVSSYKYVAFARASWSDSDYTWRRRRSDPNTNGELSEDSARCQQRQYKQFDFHDSISFS
jgi:hypothetical protein